MWIGEAAEQAGVNIQTLRYYERRGLLPRTPRRASGYREFPDDAVRIVRFIKRAQDLGFSLDEVEELLRLRRHSGRNRASHPVGRGRENPPDRSEDRRARTHESARCRHWCTRAATAPRSTARSSRRWTTEERDGPSHTRGADDRTHRPGLRDERRPGRAPRARPCIEGRPTTSAIQAASSDSRPRPATSWPGTAREAGGAVGRCPARAATSARWIRRSGRRNPARARSAAWRSSRTSRIRRR